MATVKCKFKKRGRPSHEWNDGEKDRIYCFGYIDLMTEDTLPECLSCPDHVSKAQEDLDRFLEGMNERGAKHSEGKAD